MLRPEAWLLGLDFHFVAAFVYLVLESSWMAVFFTPFFPFFQEWREIPGLSRCYMALQGLFFFAVLMLFWKFDGNARVCVFLLFILFAVWQDSRVSCSAEAGFEGGWTGLCVSLIQSRSVRSQRHFPSLLHLIAVTSVRLASLRPHQVLFPGTSFQFASASFVGIQFVSRVVSNDVQFFHRSFFLFLFSY